MPDFTEEDRTRLAPYVTDTDGDVFAVTNLKGIVGAAYARYSRAPGGFREILLKEFIKEGHLDATRAQELIERILIAFGDDSVGELEGAHLSFENITMVATKEIEDRRIGGSPIEQSTRYVFFDKKDADGHYRYYRDPAIMRSPHSATYVATMDFIFDTYCSLMDPMKAYYRTQKTIEEAEYDIDGDGTKERIADLKDEREIKAFRRTYNIDIRTKACDTLRYLLPLSTKTNVGLFGNGRFFQGLLSHCFTSDIPEVQRMAENAKKALDQVIPHYVKRAKRNEYHAATRDAMHALAARIMGNIDVADVPEVDLMDAGEAHVAAACREQVGDVDVLRRSLQDEKDVLTVSHMLYPYCIHSLNQIRDVIRAMTDEERQKIIASYVGKRGQRRNRPGRALEAGYPYTFDCLTDFGTYKDLMRHRMTTQMRQKFSPLHGFVMPPDLEKAGLADKALECHEKTVELYKLLVVDFPEQASYSALHGSKVRWLMGMNDREAMHLIELRTTPQGHASYRKVGQLMHDAIRERSEWRGDMIEFADHNDYQWARGDAEARQRVKERALEDNKG